MQMNLSGNSSAGFGANWPGRLAYFYNRSGSAKLECFNTSTGSTGITAYSISIYSPATFNKSAEDSSNQTDGIPVNLSYADPSGVVVVQRTLNSSKLSSFQFYDNNSMLLANVSFGNLSSCKGALRLSFGSDAPYFNITFSQNRTPSVSEWYFPDSFSASLMGLRMNRSVEAQVRR